MLQRWKILPAVHPIHQIWCHCPRSRCLHHTYCIPGSSFLDTPQKHRRKLEGRRMYNPLVITPPHQFPPLHTVTSIIFIKLWSGHTLIKAFQSLPYHYMHFTVWPRPILPGSSLDPFSSNHNKILITPRIFQPLSCRCGLSSETLTNAPAHLENSHVRKSKNDPLQNRRWGLTPPGSQLCLSLCSCNTLLIIPPLKIDRRMDG